MSLASGAGGSALGSGVSAGLVSSAAGASAGVWDEVELVPPVTGGSALGFLSGLGFFFFCCGGCGLGAISIWPLAYSTTWPWCTSQCRSLSTAVRSGESGGSDSGVPSAVGASALSGLSGSGANLSRIIRRVQSRFSTTNVTMSRMLSLTGVCSRFK